MQISVIVANFPDPGYVCLGYGVLHRWNERDYLDTCKGYPQTEYSHKPDYHMGWGLHCK